jgi:hypothetical protein
MVQILCPLGSISSLGEAQENDQDWSIAAVSMTALAVRGLRDVAGGGHGCTYVLPVPGRNKQRSLSAAGFRVSTSVHLCLSLLTGIPLLWALLR